ncbi:MAG TPA: hypothetical protein VK915_04120 [Gaiellaceae bacterium]|nr:hypothetical protein [Gaiellaceae bacterium]
MPHHWFFIDPDNPGPRQRAGQVRKVVREHGGRLVFVGHASKAEKEWYALVYLPSDEKLADLSEKLGVKDDLLLDEVTPEEGSS